MSKFDWIKLKVCNCDTYQVVLSIFDLLYLYCNLYLYRSSKFDWKSC